MRSVAEPAMPNDTYVPFRRCGAVRRDTSRVVGQFGHWSQTAFREMTIRAEQTAEDLHTARLRLPDGDFSGG
jgi:hypothetical protein